MKRRDFMKKVLAGAAAAGVATVVGEAEAKKVLEVTDKIPKELLDEYQKDPKQIVYGAPGEGKSQWVDKNGLLRVNKGDPYEPVRHLDEVNMGRNPCPHKYVVDGKGGLHSAGTDPDVEPDLYLSDGTKWEKVDKKFPYIHPGRSRPIEGDIGRDEKGNLCLYMKNRWCLWDPGIGEDAQPQGRVRRLTM